MEFAFFVVLITVLKPVFGDYIASVVEYNPSPTLEENLRNYEELIRKAKSQGASIIVFPEGGLHTRTPVPVPPPVGNITSSEQNNNSSCNSVGVIEKLSCAAQESQIYVVVNLQELRVISRPDNTNKTVIYNTNVVFDRKGRVIARYPKFNLFDEFDTSTTETPEITIFDTDFGVRFGTFTCFDILFQEPTLRLIRQYKVTDIVFTSKWFSELPFLTATQVQKGWAEVNNVNLLASGFNNPLRGSTGSGIYHGKSGPLVDVMEEKKMTKLLTANVSYILDSDFNGVSNKTVLSFPNSPEDTSDEHLALLSDQIELFNSSILQSGTSSVTEVCSHNNFCCNFEIEMKVMGAEDFGYKYRAVAYNGVRKFGLSYKGAVQVCGVVLCNGPDLLNCTNRASQEDVYLISKLKVEGKFLSNNSLQIPSTLTYGSHLKPLPVKEYSYNTKAAENGTHISMELLFPVRNLQTFAVWGRNFSYTQASSATSIFSQSFFFFSTILFIGILY